MSWLDRQTESSITFWPAVWTSLLKVSDRGSLQHLQRIRLSLPQIRILGKFYGDFFILTFNWPQMTFGWPYFRSVSSNTPQKTPSDQPKFCVRSKQTPTRLGTDIETGKMTPPDPVKDHDGITLHQTRPEHHVVSNESGHVIENNGNDPKQPVQKRRQLTITLPNISKQNTVWFFEPLWYLKYSSMVPYFPSEAFALTPRDKNLTNKLHFKNIKFMKTVNKPLYRILKL